MIEVLIIANTLWLLGVYMGFGGLRSPSPIPLFAAFLFIRSVPYCWLYYLGIIELDYRIEAAIGQRNLTDVFERYLLLEFLGSICFFGVLARLRLQWPTVSYHKSLPNYLAIAIASVGIAIFAFNVVAQGGVEAFLDNFHLRLGIRKESQVFQVPGLTFFLFALSVYILLQNYAEKRSALTLLAVVLICLAGVLAGAQTGGRKDSVLLIIGCVVFTMKLFPNFRLSIPSIVALLASIVVFVNLVSALRKPDGMESLTRMNSSEFLEETLFQVVPIVESISYCPHYMFIISYFDKQEFWGTGIFESGVLSAVPRFLYPEKPPLDEGVYIRSLLEGWRGRPPESYSLLYPSSMPSETLGNGYSAGGFFVTLLFFVGKALLVGLFWRLSKSLFREPVLTLALFFMLYQLEVSPYRTVQVLFVLLFCAIFQFFTPLVMQARRVNAISPQGY